MPLERRRGGGRETLARNRNRLRKLLAGLPLGGEAVWPGERTDLFVAHESVYRFAARLAARLDDPPRVLDAACGTGYGSEILSRVAAEVTGIDRSRLRLAYARRAYRRPDQDRALRFERGDLEALRLAPGSFDLVVSSNTLEHLPRPRRFLRSVEAGLAPEGRLLVAVPPILSEADLPAHRESAYHCSNLTIREWHGLFTEEGWSCRCFRHIYPGVLDFASPLPSAARVEDFRFDSVFLDELCSAPTLAAVFLLRPPAGRARRKTAG